MALLLVWFVTALSVLISAYLIPLVQVDSFVAALGVAALLGIINVTIKPLILLITLPINILTLGLFTLVINTLMLLLIDNLMTSFEAGSFWTAFILSIFISVFNSLILLTLNPKKI